MPLKEISLLSRTFVISDIHGNYGPMMDVFARAGIDYANDRLISLGDLVDRGPDPVHVLEELMKFRDFINILGNHDYWFLGYLKTGDLSPDWLYQGGRSTLEAYRNNEEKKKSHLEFYSSARYYHTDHKNRLFLHAGFDGERPFEEQKNDVVSLLWDRSLYRMALEYESAGKTFGEFSEIFIGHSPTQLVFNNQPARLANLWMMDTGAGHRRFLTIMDVDTKEFWQSSCSF